METIADAICSRIEEGLSAAAARIVANSVAAAAIVLSPIVVIAKPTAVFKKQTAKPFILQIRKRLDAAIDVEVLAVGKALQAVIALGDCRHAELKTADPAGYADAA
jgi:hypothetical protein